MDASRPTVFAALLPLTLSLAVLTTGAAPIADGEDSAARQEPERGLPRHVVLFVVDDLGWRDISPACWPDPDGPGARHFQTPHLERLVGEGVRFREAYAAAPVCTPTRTSLMTGSSPARNQITYWTRFEDKDTSASHPLLRAPSWNVNGLQPGDTTLASLLAPTHSTVHVGKAHFGTGEGGDPTRLGFEINIAGWSAGGPGSFLGIDSFSAAGRRARLGQAGGDRSWDVPGLGRFHGQPVFLTDVLAEDAEATLRSAVDAGERVFLHFAPYAVHAPITANERVLGRFEGSGLEGPELAYATMVATVDDALGRLLGALDDLGIADDTLVIYTSDNGGLSAHGRGGVRHSHNAPLRSGKGSAYEGGIRVPLVVRWPGVTEPGRVIDGAVVTQDLFPTVLGASGVPVRTERTVEGLDLRPILAGEAVPGERALLWHQPHYWGVPGPGIEPFSALRVGAHKLVYFHSGRSLDAATGARSGGPRFELYDVVADPSESTDLAHSEPARVAALAEALSVQLEAAGAGMSIDKGTGKPVPLPRIALRSWASGPR